MEFAQNSNRNKFRVDRMCKKHLLGLFLFFLIPASYAIDREIAITIDDLPFVGSSNGNPSKLGREQDRFMQLLQTLIDKKVPATGFVIAGSIEKGQWALLEAFKQAGFILGNHTYSHKNLNITSAANYIADVDRADKILDPLFPKTKYFRYPYLAESKGEKKQLVHDYLFEHHYVIAPVTVDSKDFKFNQQLYAIPYRLRDQNLNQLKRRYLEFIWNQTLKAERQVLKTKPNKVIKQVLLIHANLLNSHCLGDIIDLYRSKGYRIVSLEEILTDTTENTNNSGIFQNLFQNTVLEEFYQ